MTIYQSEERKENEYKWQSMHQNSSQYPVPPEPSSKSLQRKQTAKVASAEPQPYYLSCPSSQLVASLLPRSVSLKLQFRYP